MKPRWTPDSFKTHVKAMSAIGWKLALWEDGDVWRWEWNHRNTLFDGCCDAKTKQLAFYCAVESLS